MPAQDPDQSQSDCLICQRAQAQGSERFIYQGEHYRVRHADETDLKGYLIVEANRHFLDLSEATTAEADQLGAVVAIATKAIRAYCQPKRVYSFTLAEAVPHFHMHLLPRMEDLDSAYVGRGIMSYPLSPTLDAQTTSLICARIKELMGA